MKKALLYIILGIYMFAASYLTHVAWFGAFWSVHCHQNAAESHQWVWWPSVSCCELIIDHYYTVTIFDENLVSVFLPYIPKLTYNTIIPLYTNFNWTNDKHPPGTRAHQLVGIIVNVI